MRSTIPSIFAIALLLNACSRSEPEQVVKRYREAKDWEERLAYVKHPEIVKPLMARYYEQVATAFPQPYVEIRRPDKPEVPLGDWTQVLVILTRDKNPLGMIVTESIVYDIQHTSNGYKIDWESSIPYNPMTAAEFKSTKPTHPVRFRAIAKLSDIYPFGRDTFQEQHWSVTLLLCQRIVPTGNIEALGVGFVRRDSDAGKRLYELIRDGGDHAVTLDVSCPKQPPYDIAYFRIDHFVSPDWHRNE